MSAETNSYLIPKIGYCSGINNVAITALGGDFWSPLIALTPVFSSTETVISCPSTGFVLDAFKLNVFANASANASSFTWREDTSSIAAVVLTFAGGVTGIVTLSDISRPVAEDILIAWVIAHTNDSNAITIRGMSAVTHAS